MTDYPYRVDVDARLRNYTYKAYLTATGKVAQLRAGCRVWNSFEEAREHYDGVGTRYAAIKWSDATLTNLNKMNGFWVAAKAWAQRSDARKTLALLEAKVTRLQERIKRKRKKARKVKRAQKPAVRRRKARR